MKYYIKCTNQSGSIRYITYVNIQDQFHNSGAFITNAHIFQSLKEARQIKALLNVGLLSFDNLWTTNIESINEK